MLLIMQILNLSINRNSLIVGLMRGPAISAEDSGQRIPEVLHFVSSFAVFVVFVDFVGGEGDGAFGGRVCVVEGGPVPSEMCFSKCRDISSTTLTSES